MEDLEQLRVFIARQQAQLDQLQQQVQQQQVHQAQARQAGTLFGVAVHVRGNLWALGFGRSFETGGLVNPR